MKSKKVVFGDAKCLVSKNNVVSQRDYRFVVNVIGSSDVAPEGQYIRWGILWLQSGSPAGASHREMET